MTIPIKCEVSGCDKSSNAALNGVWLCVEHFNDKLAEQLKQIREDHIRRTLFNGQKEEQC